MPRPETGPFTGTVVDGDGKPVAGAVVSGIYASSAARGWFREIRADATGTFTTERSLDPLVLHARTPDGTGAGVARVDAEAAQAQVVIRPVATASGRLIDPEGKPYVGRKVVSGVRVYMGEPGKSAFQWGFGASLTTDDRGAFALAGLVVGERYEVNAYLDEHASRTVRRITPEAPGPIALGDIEADLSPPRPYVPPTPAQRTAEAFAARKEMSPRAKLAYVLTEAKREYTRPLLLFGRPDDPACVDLFRRFDDTSADRANDKARPRTPAELRWEFELAALDTGTPEVLSFGHELGITVDDSKAPRLAVLSEDGTVAATYPLRLGGDKALDARALGAFLGEQKLDTRDAERMLSAALERAKAGRKRVFLIMSASWCGPCRMLARFLAAHKAELEHHYVFVKLDVSRDEHADSLRARYEKGEHNGVPWYVILDDDGKPLVTSNTEAIKEEYGGTNVGFPSSKAGIDHFVSMLKQTAPGLSAEALETLRQALGRKP
jgi:thiol-disulfide isomerase/thioredoxin